MRLLTVIKSLAFTISLLAAGFLVPTTVLSQTMVEQGSRTLALHMSAQTGVSWFNDPRYGEIIKQWLDALASRNCREIDKRTEFPFFLHDHEVINTDELTGGDCSSTGSSVPTPDGIAFSRFGDIRNTEAIVGDHFLQFGHVNDEDLYFIVVIRGKAAGVLASISKNGKLRFKGYWS